MYRKLSTGVLLVALAATSAFGQVAAGLSGMSGVVRDASGGTVPNAAVSVSNESKGIKRTLETNSDGVFTAPALVPSAGYVVTVTAAGYTPAHWGRTVSGMLVTVTVSTSDGRELIKLQRVACN